jgi:hypothetical protein
MLDDPAADVTPVGARLLFCPKGTVARTHKACRDRVAPATHMFRRSRAHAAREARAPRMYEDNSGVAGA